MKYIKRSVATIVSVALSMGLMVSIPVLAAPPYGGSVTIGPEPAYTDTDLTATPSGWIDDGVGHIIIYEYEWQKWDGTDWVTIVGAPNGDTLAGSSYFIKGDQIRVSCTPSDGTEDGFTVESNEITISNKAPYGGSVTIGPDPAYTDTDITATPSGWIDDDVGDIITYEYEWQKWDDTVWVTIAGVTEATLGSTNFVYGDQIRVVCTPSDGTEDGFTVESNEIDITSYSISIDVKPGSSVNPINLGSQGVIPVAIITTEGFDATTVDAGTVRFGPGKAQAVHSAIEDIDDDGDDDMILHFRTQDAGIEEDDTEVVLTGETVSGETVDARHFTGTDTIWIVPSRAEEAVKGNESAPGQNKEPGESAEGKGKESAPGQNKEPGESATGKAKGKDK
ncbi:hypothetical protein ACFLY3_01260 [Chloroflexota bacterium]